MRMLFTVSRNQTLVDLVLLIARVGIALSVLTHGIPKLMTLFSTPAIQFPDPLGVGVGVSLALVVMAEVACSVVLLLGLLTRWAMLPLMFTMGVAVLIIHSGAPFSVREMPVLYFLFFLLFLVMGPGKFSLDFWISKKCKK